MTKVNLCSRWDLEYNSLESLPKASSRVLAANRAQQRLDDNDWIVYLLALVLCLPRSWYFLLDRIRELVDAVAGRSR